MGTEGGEYGGGVAVVDGVVDGAVGVGAAGVRVGVVGVSGMVIGE